MKTICLPNTDLTVSPLCLGTMPFGYGLPEADMERLYATYRAAGGNCVDTAHCYAFWKEPGAGASERVLGRILKRAGDRKHVVVMTKGGHPSVPPAYMRPDRYLSPEVIEQDLKESLDHLGLEYVDVYFLHRDDARVPVNEIIDCLSMLVGEGRIHHLGASNWSTQRIAEANMYARWMRQTRFAVSQPMFHLAQPKDPPAVSDPALRYLTDGDIAWHTQTQFSVFAYTPAAKGYFATAGREGAAEYDTPVNRARLARVQQLATTLGATPNQVALAWVMSHPFPAIPILGTANPEHLHDALGAAALQLTAEQVRWLKEG